MNILIAYDGTLHAKKAISYGLEKARRSAGRVAVLQVFDPGLFIDYDAGPKAKELALAEARARFQEAEALLRDHGSGIECRAVFEEGEVATMLERHAAESAADLILVPATLKRLAGSLSRPTVIVPGVVLVPVDSGAASQEYLDEIVREARGMGSRVHLVGIVPVHLYSREETDELQQVRNATVAALHGLSAALAERNIEAGEELRSGYPDEEILKSAEAQGASLILLPSGGTTPSELSKAAAVLLEEPAQLKWPLVLVPRPDAP